MEILREACTGCEVCLPYCVVGAIEMVEGIASVDLDKCVECGSCIRTVPCPGDAFHQVPLSWPRVIRAQFSDSVVTIDNHPTLGAGRGVIEVKTIDRTNYYRSGEIGFFIEMGRPGVSASMADVEKITQAFARHGFLLVDYSPVAPLMVDRSAGKLRADILNERVQSCTLEFRGTLATVREIIGILQDAEGQVNTVFSVGVMCRVDPPYSIPVLPILAEAGIAVRPNAKINMGLGEPITRESGGDS